MCVFLMGGIILLSHLNILCAYADAEIFCPIFQFARVLSCNFFAANSMFTANYLIVIQQIN